MKQRSAERTIWTIGHSTRTLPEFLHLLGTARIEAIADVRRFPGSRRFPHFGGEQLMAELRKNGIDYVHFAELGGRRAPKPDSKNLAWRVAAFRGYADYMETSEFKAGMARLAQVAERRKTALMCAEALWWQCHRGLVSDALKAQGWTVCHIMGGGKIEIHPFTKPARLIGGVLNYEVDSKDEMELPLAFR